MLLGKISGRVTTQKFSFVAEARVKKMQYIAVKDSEGNWVLGYINSLVRYGNETIAKVMIIGYRDSRGFLKTPSVPFSPDTPIFAADPDMIKKTIGLKDSGAYIGLLNDYDLKVCLPIKHLITKHVSILAKTGAGKSYAAGVLIEELAENGVPAVIIDPHGEYSSLIFENKNPKELELMERFGVEPKSYEENMRIFDVSGGGADQLKLNSKLSMPEILEILPRRPSSSQQGLLYMALKNLKGKNYTIRDIIDEINAMDAKSKWGILSMLGNLDETKLFSPVPTKITDIVSKGRITIINLKNARPEIQGMVVMKLTEELFDARKKDKIPPFFLVVEEAHNFCPERGLGEVPSSKVLRTIAAEGRKFGMGLCIISQRPAKVDKNVLSQCNTQIILKVTNPNDLKAIIDSVEGVGTTTKDQIKELPIGQALIVGITDQPLVVSIRIKRSDHGGESLKARNAKGVSRKFDVFDITFLEDDMHAKFKGIDKMKLVYYPLWEVKGNNGENKRPFYVDGMNGEIVYEEEDAIKRTKGLMKLLSLPPLQRLIMLYLFKNKQTTADKMADDLKIPKESIVSSIEELIKDGKIEKNGEEIQSAMKLENIPYQIADAVIDKKKGKVESIENRLDFLVSSDYLKRVGELWGVSVIDSKQVYYPYWMVEHRGKEVLIDAVKGSIDIEKTRELSGKI
ncbi:MAG: ATP-binding protein [Candidatus Micrarchaeota archaeon]|nr:ATP-binding protein [Candidatus Micrarchaeota archaeon]